MKTYDSDINTAMAASIGLCGILLGAIHIMFHRGWYFDIVALVLGLPVMFLVGGAIAIVLSLWRECIRCRRRPQ